MIGLGHALSHSLAAQGVMTPPFVGALDGFRSGLWECWSHRRTLLAEPASATILQGRRTSDSQLINVGKLANGELDEASLMSFAGSGSVAVAALKGQFAGLNMLQATADEQRIIVDAGSLVTVGEKAASRGLRVPAGTPDHGGVLKTDNFAAYTGSVLSVFIRGAHGTYSGWFNGISDAYFALGLNGSGSAIGHPGIARSPAGAIQLTWIGNTTGGFVTDYLLSFIWDGTNVTVRDGTNTYQLADSASFNFTRFLIGAFDDNTTEYSSSDNNIQEMAVWTTDQTANEAAIRSAMLA